MKYILSVLMLTLTMGFTACNPSGSGSEDVNTLPPLGSDPVPSLQSLVISSVATTTAVNLTTQFNALGIYSDDTKDVTTEVTWKSSDDSIVTIDKNGLATAKAPGSVDISATLANIDSNKENIFVATLVSISIENADKGDSLTVANPKMIVGTTQQAKAIGKFDNNAIVDITTNVTWKTDTSATISVDNNGLIKAIGVGAAHVSAEYLKINSTLIKDNLNGTVETATLLSLDITGSNVSSVKNKIQLTASAFYDNNITIDVTNDVNWSSFDGSIISKNISVNENGTVTASIADNAIIKAELSNKIARHYVTFTTKTIDHIELQESYVEDASGKVITETTIDLPIVNDVTYPNEGGLSEGAYYPTAWAVYTDGTKEYVGDKAFWWSDHQQEAYINYIKGSFVFGRDLVDGAIITAVYAGKKAFFKVNVQNLSIAPSLTSIELKLNNGAIVSNGSINLAMKDKVWVTAYGTYSDGNTSNINSSVFYTSSNPKNAWIFDVVNSNIHGRSIGDANITASWQGKTATVTVHVLNEADIVDSNDSKNAKALNAIAYRVLIPTFAKVRDVLNSSNIDNEISKAPELITVDCDDRNSSNGQYTINREANKVTIDYGTGTCKAINSATVTTRALAECGLSFLSEGIPFLGLQGVNDANITSSSYYVLTEGKIVCTKTTNEAGTTLEMDMQKHKSTNVNHSSGNNSSWYHNYKIALKNSTSLTFAMTGSTRGQLYNGQVDGGILINDEEYIVKNFTIDMDLVDGEADTLATTGSVAYKGRVRENDPTNPNLTLTLNFDKYKYIMDGPTEDLTIKTTGTVGASCLGGAINYTTSTILNDVNSSLDARGDRFPSSGEMGISSIDLEIGQPRNTQATIVFSPSNAAITTNNDVQNYDSWRTIIEGSSCEILQDIIDRTLPQD